MPQAARLLDILKAFDADTSSATPLRPTHRALLEADEAKKRTIRSHSFIQDCFDFDPVTGHLRWREYRPRTHFRDAPSWRRWESRCAGLPVRNARTISVTYQGRNETLSPSKIAAVVLTGRDYDDVKSVSFRDGDRTNLRATNLQVSFRYNERH
jgi:hypothetical protein